jgi:uncharacterized protein YxjI
MHRVDPAWSRFIVKSKHGAGRDFKVTTVDGDLAYTVDGKLGTRPKALVKDAAGQTRLSVKGHLIGVPKRLEIEDARGGKVGTLKAKMLSPIKDRETLHLVDGTEWRLKGSFMEKNYRIKSGSQPVAEVSQKWVTIRDAYSVDVADGYDPALVLALIWSVDRWVERD